MMREIDTYKMKEIVSDNEGERERGGVLLVGIGFRGREIVFLAAALSAWLT